MNAGDRDDAEITSINHPDTYVVASAAGAHQSIYLSLTNERLNDVRLLMFLMTGCARCDYLYILCECVCVHEHPARPADLTNKHVHELFMNTPVHEHPAQVPLLVNKRVHKRVHERFMNVHERFRERRPLIMIRIASCCTTPIRDTYVIFFLILMLMYMCEL